ADGSQTQARDRARRHQRAIVLHTQFRSGEASDTVTLVWLVRATDVLHERIAVRMVRSVGPYGLVAIAALTEADPTSVAYPDAIENVTVVREVETHRIAGAYRSAEVATVGDHSVRVVGIHIGT